MDVVDTARLHAIALFSPFVTGERLFAAAGPFTWEQVVETLRHIQPNNTRIPNFPLDERATLGKVAPAARAEKLLQEYFGQSTWTPLPASLIGGIQVER